MYIMLWPKWQSPASMKGSAPSFAMNEQALAQCTAYDAASAMSAKYNGSPQHQQLSMAWRRAALRAAKASACKASWRQLLARAIIARGAVVWL